MRGDWNYPTRIRFGAGRLAEIASVLAETGVERPLIVTDPGLAGLPMLAELSRHCANAARGAICFADSSPNPVGADVDAGARIFRETDRDGVIAIGGGSAIDVGKAIALVAHQDHPLWQFEDVGDNWTRADSARIAPTVAIPTTAGTGSEVGRSRVIIDEEATRKVIVFHPAMLPVQVICDPVLTRSLPPHLTAATGMDALSHSLEAFCARGFHPMADGIAVEGMRLVAAHLEDATAQGDNLDARSGMLAASLMGATAFQKGLGAMHAMAHPIGAALGAHHGLINAVLMPYVIARNRPAIESRLTQLAVALELPGGGYEAVQDWILELRARLSIPHTVEALGVTEANLDMLAKAAAIDPAGGGNPIALTAAGYRTLLGDALRGSLSSSA